ncbi:MAG: PD-(D/E)XK nuclease family protein, partial [Magnetococcales bacterium]|nr:PD-(D/E)XK nuclease family protein [Magnetococcales bacterium]
DIDVQAFRSWQTQVEERCNQEGWLTSAQVPAWLTRHPGSLTTGPHLLLAGFDRPSPAQQRLWDCLSQQGIIVTHWQPLEHPAEVHRVVFPDSASEIMAAALWTRQRLEEDPQNRIGVIVPELQRIREPVTRIFAEILHADTLGTNHDATHPLFNVSLGAPLAGYPLIQEMLLLLEGMRGRWSLSDIGALLRSPCLAGGESERFARALLDRHLREEGHPHLTLEQWQQRAEKTIGDASCPLLHRLLTRAMALLPQPEPQTPRTWIDRFSSWLAAWGWPGERPLTSREFQIWEAGRTLLTTFATLEQVMARMPLAEALQRLRHLAHQQLYQPETPDAAPVQILGILEAAGEPFTALWLLGLAGDLWPAPPAPNPFLPLAWQRQRNVPRATAAGELEFAGRLTGRLLSSAPQVVVSHARMAEDLPQRPSPLFAHLPELPPDTLNSGSSRCYQRYWQKIQATALWETCDDQQGPPLEPGMQAAGGARILKSQAECPFQAFALHRLGATPLPEAEPMLDARTRGILVHHLLEQFWRETPSLQDLRDLDSATLTTRIRKAVIQAVRRESERKPEWFPPALRHLEENRLTRLLTAWLELERTRNKSFQVVFREASLPLDVGGLILHLRPDRVDQLEDGRHVVLDYKTGDPQSSHWFGPRPREPQLPLYCLLQGESVAALAFARLRPDKPGFVGLGVEKDLLPIQHTLEMTLRKHNIAAWPELLDRWRDDLTGLAKEFLTGVASVSPLPGACDTCQLSPLCRIHTSGDPANLENAES